jgi:hypothetical protein
MSIVEAAQIACVFGEMSDKSLTDRGWPVTRIYTDLTANCFNRYWSDGLEGMVGSGPCEVRGKQPSAAWNRLTMEGENQMTNEQIITQFLQTQYSDERLAMLLAHAEDGKLAYYSCCCFAGVPTATHALQGDYKEVAFNVGISDHEYHPDWNWDTREVMSRAYAHFALTDELRRAKLIPLIEAEMARREMERSESQVEVAVLAGGAR